MVPFVVAITGHRNIEPADIATVEEELFRALELVTAALPYRPIHFLSALADGSDQLFAQQVLRLQKRIAQTAPGDKDRLRLIVPLPMPFDEYCSAQAGGEAAARRDDAVFQTAKREFAARVSALAAAASDMFVVSSAAQTKMGSEPSALAAEPYVRLAQYLRAHADLMVTVWDGKTVPSEQFPRLAGGTLDTVLSLLEGGTHDEAEAVPDDFTKSVSSNVVHVYARRAQPSSVGLAPAAGWGMGFSLAVNSSKQLDGRAVIEHIPAPQANWAGVNPPAIQQWLVDPFRAWKSLARHRAWKRLIGRTEHALHRKLEPAALAVLYRIDEIGRKLQA
jgi:hypothetical protein